MNGGLIKGGKDIKKKPDESLHQAFFNEEIY